MTNETIKRYYMDGPHFINANPNPMAEGRKGWKWDRADCTIRALALAASCSWLEAFDYLATKARRDFNVPNDGPGFRKWLIEGGAKWTACKAEKGKKRMTVEGFARTHTTGHYVLTVAHHETACVDGVIMDVWNCGDSCMVGYFDMSEFKL